MTRFSGHGCGGCCSPGGGDAGSSVGVNQSGKSGGDAFGSAGAGASAGAGSGMGMGSGYAGCGSGAAGMGAGMGGDAGAGAGAVGAGGGDATDNTAIGSINVSS